MRMVKMAAGTFLAGASTLLAPAALAEEIVVGSVNLPGASLNQEITYHPNKKDYDDFKRSILERLRRRDSGAMVNPTSGPWMRVETTATIGVEYKGVGISSGRKNVRQISAAEEALFQFEKEGRK